MNLPEPKYINTTEKNPGYNSDIISVIENRFPGTLEQTGEFAKQFDGGTVEKTAYNVWHWLKSNVRYLADGSHQKIKSPSRLVYDGEGDCFLPPCQIGKGERKEKVLHSLLPLLWRTMLQSVSVTLHIVLSVKFQLMFIQSLKTKQAEPSLPTVFGTSSIHKKSSLIKLTTG